MKTWIALLVPAIVIVVLLGYLIGSRAIPQSAQDNLANAAAMPAAGSRPPVDTPPASGNEPSADNPVAALPIEPAAPVAAPMPAASRETDADDADHAPPDSQDQDDGADAQAQAEIARAIRSATLDALDDGEPKRWHKDGLTGYISVSEPRDTATGSCRNVTATMGSDDEQSQSSIHRWCRDDDGDWAPR